jgi:hypothetical protein
VHFLFCIFESYMCFFFGGAFSRSCMCFC